MVKHVLRPHSDTALGHSVSKLKTSEHRSLGGRTVAIVSSLKLFLHPCLPQPGVLVSARQATSASSCGYR
jgi:hypothetical protein